MRGCTSHMLGLGCMATARENVSSQQPCQGMMTSEAVIATYKRDLGTQPPQLSKLPEPLPEHDIVRAYRRHRRNDADAWLLPIQ